MWRGVSWVNNGAGRPSSPRPPAQPETLLRTSEPAQVRNTIIRVATWYLIFDIMLKYSFTCPCTDYRPSTTGPAGVQ